MKAFENNMDIQQLKQDINAILSNIDNSGTFVSEHAMNMLAQEIKKRGYTKNNLFAISGSEIAACNSGVDTNWDYGYLIQEIIDQYDEPAISHEQAREYFFYTKRMPTILEIINFVNRNTRKMSGIEYIALFMEQYKFLYGNKQGDLLKTRDYIEKIIWGGGGAPPARLRD
jgi:hypothetical protein